MVSCHCELVNRTINVTPEECFEYCDWRWVGTGSDDDYSKAQMRQIRHSVQDHGTCTETREESTKQSLFGYSVQRLTVLAIRPIELFVPAP